MLFIGLLIAAFAPSQGQVPDKARSARDAEVVRAIQEELLTPYARQNLGICPPVPAVPCISQSDVNQARSGTEPFKGRLYAAVSHWPADNTLRAGDAALVPPALRGRFERVAKCHSSFKSRLPDSDDFFRNAALNHRRPLERALACLIETPGIATLATDYAAHARILYEWEGMSESPLQEAAYAEAYISENAESPLLPYLYLFVAERARYAFEMLEGEKNPERMTTQAARYGTFIARARSADPMVALVANDFDGLSFVYLNIGKHPRDYRR